MSTVDSAKKPTSTRKRKRPKQMRCWPEPRYIVKSSTDNVTVVRYFVDGACSGNQFCVDKRTGGYGGVCEQTGETFSAALEPPCSNNRGELQAVIYVLKKECETVQPVDKTREVRIVGDNTVVLDTISLWLDGWKKRAQEQQTDERYLKANGGGPPKNKDLVHEIDILIERFKREERPLSVQWVSAHADAPSDKDSDLYKMWVGNNHADRLAVQGAKN